MAGLVDPLFFIMPGKVTVSIQYCGGCGYGKHYKTAEQILKEKFKGVSGVEVR
jgi:hypothetical protein